MNTTQHRNNLHQEALDITAQFVKSGGKIIKPSEDYKGQEWQAPKPKRLVIHNRKGV